MTGSTDMRQCLGDYGAGYFWPGWFLGAWGMLLLLDLLSFLYRRPLTEADVDRELARRR